MSAHLLHAGVQVAAIGQLQHKRKSAAHIRAAAQANDALVALGDGRPVRLLVQHFLGHHVIRRLRHVKTVARVSGPTNIITPVSSALLSSMTPRPAPALTRQYTPESHHCGMQAGCIHACAQVRPWLRQAMQARGAAGDTQLPGPGGTSISASVGMRGHARKGRHVRAPSSPPPSRRIRTGAPRRRRRRPGAAARRAARPADHEACPVRLCNCV